MRGPCPHRLPDTGATVRPVGIGPSGRAYDLADDEMGTYVLCMDRVGVVDVGANVMQASITDGIARIVGD